MHKTYHVTLDITDDTVKFVKVSGDKSDDIENIPTDLMMKYIQIAIKMSIENIIEKLKERQGFSKRKHRLAQKGSEEEAFWDGHIDGLAVAITIVECE